MPNKITKMDMQKLEEFLKQELENADKEKTEYFKELLKVVRFSSASKYYNHV